MLTNKKMILILFFIGISLIYYTIVHSVNISNRLIGTYQCEESIRLSMIFDSDHSFYISDYIMKKFILHTPPAQQIKIVKIFHF